MTDTAHVHTLQVVVYDSLEYCASTNNLSAVKGKSNFKVCSPAVRQHVLLQCTLWRTTSTVWQSHAWCSCATQLCADHTHHTLPPVAHPPQFVKGDIQTADLIRYVLESEEIDTVMHFAAQVRFFRALRCGT